MNNPQLYQRANCVQRYDAQRVLQRHAGALQWRRDGKDALIDIGSGSGDVLMDFVYPLLPPNFRELLVTDVSPRMTDFARKRYMDRKNTRFEVLDIGTKELPQHLQGRFDHATSFYCLHWVQDQLQALENVYKLLHAEGGDCLLVFLAANAIFEAQSKDPKWANYLHDCEQFSAPLRRSADPGAEHKQLLQQAGFAAFEVEVWEETHFYEGVVSFRDNVKAVCPYLDRMPPAVHEEFFDDCVKTAADMNLREKIANSDDHRFGIPYKLVVTYARKSHQRSTLQS